MKIVRYQLTGFKVFHRKVIFSLKLMNQLNIKNFQFSPCITCVQYRGECSIPWGVFSTGLHIMMHVGDILSTVGDILSTVGVILSTMGDTQCRGGIS